METKLKSIINYSMLATFLAITFLLASCSWGGSNENSGEKGTEITTTVDDDSQKQEMREESSDIEVMDPKTVDEVTDDEVYTMAEKMPEFPGGEEALMKYLSENLEYPELATEDKLEGKVTIGFVVQEDGKVVDVEVLEGIGGGCDEEAVRVVNAMPNWSPGYEKGKPVKVEYSLPIAFKLR